MSRKTNKNYWVCRIRSYLKLCIFLLRNLCVIGARYKARAGDPSSSCWKYIAPAVERCLGAYTVFFIFFLCWGFFDFHLCRRCVCRGAGVACTLDIMLLPVGGTFHFGLVWNLLRALADFYMILLALLCGRTLPLPDPPPQRPSSCPAYLCKWDCESKELECAQAVGIDRHLPW